MILEQKVSADHKRIIGVLSWQNYNQVLYAEKENLFFWNQE